MRAVRAEVICRVRVCGRGHGGRACGQAEGDATLVGRAWHGTSYEVVRLGRVVVDNELRGFDFPLATRSTARGVPGF